MYGIFRDDEQEPRFTYTDEEQAIRTCTLLNFSDLQGYYYTVQKII